MIDKEKLLIALRETRESIEGIAAECAEHGQPLGLIAQSLEIIIGVVERDL